MVPDIFKHISKDTQNWKIDAHVFSLCPLALAFVVLLGPPAAAHLVAAAALPSCFTAAAAAAAAAGQRRVEPN